MDDLKRTYYGIAIDPLHVGTGGYRLGRVDNTIVRDPGSDLPKVPGSSLSGVCRNYSIYGLEGEEKAKALSCAKADDPKIQGNCGKCIICKTFGFASGTDKTNQMGMIKFFDALIAAFPLATMCGPVWVTTPGILGDLGGAEVEPGGKLITSFDVEGNKLNLGWLLLDTEKKSISLPASNGQPKMQAVNKRLVVAPDNLFPSIVNNNLEVRTSVAIDFKTGAAKTGALFTYEAIPRATLLYFDLVVDTFRCTEDHSSEKVWEIIQSGLDLFPFLGLGGMNTRGFGRLKVISK